MPRKRPPKPEWTEQIENKVDAFADQYRENVRRVADALPRQEHCEVILERHVDAAFEALAHSGLSRRRFWKRPEFQISWGAFLIGIAWVFPDVLPVFFDAKWLEKQGVTIACILIPLTVGLFLAIHGWYRAFWGK